MSDQDQDVNMDSQVSPRPSNSTPNGKQETKKKQNVDQTAFNGEIRITVVKYGQ